MMNNMMPQVPAETIKGVSPFPSITVEDGSIKGSGDGIWIDYKIGMFSAIVNGELSIDEMRGLLAYMEANL